MRLMGEGPNSRVLKEVSEEKDLGVKVTGDMKANMKSSEQCHVAAAAVLHSVKTA